MQFQININIDAQGVNAINEAGQTVTIVKSVDSSLSDPQTVVWLAFPPFETNQVTWQEEYLLYASTTLIQAGATIMMTSQTGPVQAGNIYTFQDGGFSSGTPQGGLAFSVSDQMQAADPLTFGLAQSATVNNVSTLAPLNAVGVLFNEVAAFVPQETLSIFLSSVTNNGSVITTVSSNALVVTLTSENPTATIGFNDETNTFFLVS